ncbi:MAG: NAD(P)-dependent oxidoreductase [Betaproteobacteria bacterium]|nr:NAD(P)-dependent oxidoreductase [Betaproteobacteria bacterium]
MRVGFIGLGTMGGRVALVVRAAGHELVVNDLRRDAASRHLQAGATWADSPREAAENSEVVFTSLPGPREVESVADQLIEGMRPGTAWFDLSTNSPTLIRKLHTRFGSKGIQVFDAPISGGAPSPTPRKLLAVWVGGDETAFNRYRPLLDGISSEVLYIGPIGAGSIAKLVNNCAGYAIQTALAEVFSLGVKAGVDPLALWGAVRQSSTGRLRTFDRLGKQYLQGVFEPADFALDLAQKDIALATELGRELGVPMRVANLAHAEMTEAVNRGWAKRDSRSAMLLQNERAGVEIKVPGDAIAALLKRDG